MSACIYCGDWRSDGRSECILPSVRRCKCEYRGDAVIVDRAVLERSYPHRQYPYAQHQQAVAQQQDMSAAAYVRKIPRLEPDGTVEYLNDDPNTNIIVFRDKYGQEQMIMNAADFFALQEKLK